MTACKFCKGVTNATEIAQINASAGVTSLSSRSLARLDRSSCSLSSSCSFCALFFAAKAAGWRNMLRLLSGLLATLAVRQRTAFELGIDVRLHELVTMNVLNIGNHQRNVKQSWSTPQGLSAPLPRSVLDQSIAFGVCDFAPLSDGLVYLLPHQLVVFLQLILEALHLIDILRSDMTCTDSGDDVFEEPLATEGVNERLDSKVFALAPAFG